MSDWYKQNIPYILRELATDLERGLSKEEAKLRVEQYGENLIDRPKQLLLIRNFFAQFRNLTVFSLLVMVAVFVVFRDSDQFRKSLQLDSSNDAVTVAIAIGGILVFQILWRFIEEVRLASQIETIRDRCEVSVSVIRDGNETRIPPTAVVPGDILILIEGDYISADARLVDVDGLVVSPGAICHLYEINPMFGLAPYLCDHLRYAVGESSQRVLWCTNPPWFDVSDAAVCDDELTGAVYSRTFD